MSSRIAQNPHWLRRSNSAKADTYFLVHGFAGGWQSWEDVAAALPPEANIAAVVLPGHETNATGHAPPAATATHALQHADAPPTAMHAPHAADTPPTAMHAKLAADTPPTAMHAPLAADSPPAAMHAPHAATHPPPHASPTAALAPEAVRFSGFNAIAAWLADCMRAVGPTHAVGYSAGGRVLLAAVLAGAPCARLSLVSSGFGNLTPDERAARTASDAAWSELLRNRGMPAFIDAWESQPLFASQLRAPISTRDRQRALRLALDPNALADTLDALSVARMPDLTAAIPSLPIPLQLIAGADDPKYVANARSIPNAHVTILDHCGHNPLLEAPEALAHALQNFRR